jgi:hypothetical protein
LFFLLVFLLVFFSVGGGGGGGGGGARELNYLRILSALYLFPIPTYR